MIEEKILTDAGTKIVNALPGAATDNIRQVYQQNKFVQLDGFVSPETLGEIVKQTMPLVRQYTTRRVQKHKAEAGTLAGGYRFGRIDWGTHEGSSHTSADREAILAGFDRGGLTTFAAELAHRTLPFLEHVVGSQLAFDRVFLLVYSEGDFIDPHGDSQTSRRIMVQMPVAHGCRTALRVLQDGFLEPFYDEPGCMRLLGAGIWHDVLPILRLEPNVDPERVLISLRFALLDDTSTSENR